MNKLWHDLKQLAKHEHRSFSRSTLSFSDELSINQISKIIQEAKLLGCDVSSKNLSDVFIFNDFVVKYERKRFKRRFKESKLNLNNPSKGNEGFFGEVYNTLVAKNQELPSHDVLALQFNHLSLKSVIIYRKSLYKSAIEYIKENPSNIEKILHNTFDFMYDSLNSKIYHGDTNTSNIFLAPDFKSGHFIDLELAVPLRYNQEKALCIQISNMRNRLLVDLISEEDFQNVTTQYLNNKFDKQELIALFNHYYKLKLNSEERFKKIRLITNKGSSKLTI
ncbi:hypothetical protein LNTAR_20593 [Lentisphaera araneosa HTCC2155]|uniref:Protein kinase domain-containing protein n=1 Tax=Lentisphaera araneosa HTCC2155 TaxID=313628 RepID=A6DL41_9BACT|nr:hypothetical protein [Lentisphaera araneosa]EDM27643.1 hypothetical protein LNTAR_20593 [Lentisphaera araneosa HTCC2155]